MLDIGPDAVVMERGDVLGPNPSPTCFWPARNDWVSRPRLLRGGDAVWDLLAARRAGMLSVGVLSGGYGEDELMRAGAFRVYQDPAELRVSLDELGLLQ